MLPLAPLLEIVTPASSQQLVDLATLKADLSIGDASQDARLTRVINAVSGQVASYIGRPLIEATYRETRWIDAEDRLLDLQRVPVTAIGSVVESGVTLASTLYSWIDGQGLLRLDAGGDPTSWARAKVVVTYTAGWIPTTGTPTGAQIVLPADLYEAALAACRAAFLAKDRDPGVVVRSETVPDIYQATYDTRGTTADDGDLYGLPPATTDVLDAYCRASFLY
jgi:hypothetical protein